MIFGTENDLLPAGNRQSLHTTSGQVSVHSGSRSFMDSRSSPLAEHTHGLVPMLFAGLDLLIITVAGALKL